MRRRDFIKIIAGSATVWPLVARAQQPTMPVVGFLNSLGSNDRSNLRDAFHRGLAEAGFVPGSNLAIEYRYADNQVHRLPALAADLVGRRVAVIAATGGGASVQAAKEATTAIPIVFASAGDPVKEGYVASLNRPGGNLTGVTWFGTLVSGKGFGLLHELVPNATHYWSARQPEHAGGSAHATGPARNHAHTWPPVARAQCQLAQRNRHGFCYATATTR
jgi:putative ABC transport system substrate-binding protein